jgi:hypothetical protein
MKRPRIQHEDEAVMGIFHLPCKTLPIKNDNSPAAMTEIAQADNRDLT